MAHLHIVNVAAERAVATLRRRDVPQAAVVGFGDPLNVGPLWDLDDGAQARLAFWNRIGADEWDETFARDEREWGAVRDPAVESVTVWYGEHPIEYLLMLRSTAMLEHSSTPLFEIANTNTHPRLPRFFNAISLTRSEELPSLIAKARPIPDRGQRAARWRALTRTRDAMFRDLEAGQVVELPANGYDDRLVAATKHNWKKTALVVGEVLSDTPVSDGVLGSRVRELIVSGRLLGRGVGPFGPHEVSLPHRE
jgi:hypothetical protein